MTTAIAPSRATSTTWEIDPAHTHVEFAVKHMMISTVKGRFGDVKGTIHLDDAEPANSSVDVTIGVASIDTRQEQRDGHLRSPDFFDAERHPAMTFRSKRVTAGADGDLRIVGDLTIRTIVKEVVLDVTPEGRRRDPWGKERAGFSAKGKLNRRDFGLTYNQALEAGGFLVGDDIKLSVDVELVQTAEVESDALAIA